MTAAKNICTKNRIWRIWERKQNWNMNRKDTDEKQKTKKIKWAKDNVIMSVFI